MAARIRHRPSTRMVAAAAVLFASVMLGLGLMSQPTTAQEPDDEPLPTAAFVAQAGDFADALTASSIAAQLGAPMFLTPSDDLAGDTSDALQATDPDVVILAGGTAALSESVEQQIGEALPDADVQRRGGANRMETAVLLADLAEDMGFDRPVLTGATVDGVAGIEGLEVDGQDVSGVLSDLTGRIEDIEQDEGGGGNGDSELADRVTALEDGMASAEGRIDDLESTVADQATTISDQATTIDDQAATIADLESRIESLEDLEPTVQELDATFSGVRREEVQMTDDETEVLDTLIFEGMNVQIANGGGETSSTNGFGNLLLGYVRPEDRVRTGSHNLILGDRHSWSSWGGIVAGQGNSILAEGNVAFGFGNVVDGFWASTLGGYDSENSGTGGAILGGDGNIATGDQSVVVGGDGNQATGNSSVAAGGVDNVADGRWAGAFGGRNNQANADWNASFGGFGNTVTGPFAAVLGGTDNTADGARASVTGGSNNTASGENASVSGGQGNTANGDHSSILGGDGETVDGAHGIYPTDPT